MHAEELRRLERRLGRALRILIHVPDAGVHVTVSAAWSCGCRADGDDFSILQWEPCADHGPPRLRAVDDAGGFRAAGF